MVESKDEEVEKQPDSKDRETTEHSFELQPDKIETTQTEAPTPPAAELKSDDEKEESEHEESKTPFEKILENPPIDEAAENLKKDVLEEAPLAQEIVATPLLPEENSSPALEEAINLVKEIQIEEKKNPEETREASLEEKSVKDLKFGEIPLQESPSKNLMLEKTAGEKSEEDLAPQEAAIDEKAVEIPEEIIPEENVADNSVSNESVAEEKVANNSEANPPEDLARQEAAADLKSPGPSLEESKELMPGKNSEEHGDSKQNGSELEEQPLKIPEQMASLPEENLSVQSNVENETLKDFEDKSAGEKDPTEVDETMAKETQNTLDIESEEKTDEFLEEQDLNEITDFDEKKSFSQNASENDEPIEIDYDQNFEKLEQDPEEAEFDPELSPGEMPSFQHMDLELSETGRWLLKVVSGPNNGAEFYLQASNTYLIGTDPNVCDIVFHDNSVSRQHARLSLNAEDTIFVEDLNSRNGTLVDAEALTKREVLEPNILVTLGSTSFVLIDREGQMQTIISPYLPSIVRMLQENQSKAEKEQPSKPAVEPVKTEENIAVNAPDNKEPITKDLPHKEQHLGMILLTAIVVGIGAVAVTAITSLFSPATTVVMQKRDVTEVLDKLEKQYPSLRFSFNKATGRLLVVGHLLTAVDRHELLYQLQNIPEITTIDEKVIVDEYVWQEANQILSRTPSWRGISVHAFSPGKFVLSGYLQTHDQAERLYDYISSNFPYLDLLDKQVTIEEDVVSAVSNALRKNGFPDVKVQMQEGELSLAGGVPQKRRAEFQTLLTDFSKIPGVREVRNMALNLAAEQSLIDVSDRYEVTGFSQTNGKYSVIIGKRALYEGDLLDGMRIEKITPNAILLDKDGVKYRIHYSS